MFTSFASLHDIPDDDTQQIKVTFTWLDYEYLMSVYLLVLNVRLGFLPHFFLPKFTHNHANWPLKSIIDDQSCPEQVVMNIL